jgi:hypothetical protein
LVAISNFVAPPPAHGAVMQDGATPPAARSEDEIAALLRRIAADDSIEARDATDELIERLTRPLNRALQAYEPGTIRERRRVEAALSRLTGRIRARLFRAGLSAEERRLFDEFAELNAPLVDRLFDDDPRRRRAALSQIPIEPASGAGVLAVGKLYDSDEDVIVAAFDVIREFGDDTVVMRGLMRVIRATTEVLKGGHYDVNEPWLAEGMAVFAGEAARVLGEQRVRDAAPVIADALTFYQGTPLRLFYFHGMAKLYDRTEPIDALLAIGDKRAAPALMGLLEDREVSGKKPIAAGNSITRTVGDEALLALLRLYGLSPDDYGFKAGGDERNVIGFVDDKSRQLAVHKFRAWHREHGGGAAASQPAAGSPGG